MHRNMRLCMIAVVIVGCIAALCWSRSVGQDRKNYEVEAQVYSVPGYQSDAARAIAACERLMQRYMDLTERGLAAMAADVKVLTGQLDAVEARLERLDTRLARIERHLGVAPAPRPATAAQDPNVPPADSSRAVAPPVVPVPR